MSKNHRRNSSWPNGLMSDEQASLKVQMLSTDFQDPLNFHDGKDSLGVPDNLDDFPDNISDISEAISYKSIPISDEEKLRRELLYQTTCITEPKFSAYNYSEYKSRNDVLPQSRSFDLDMNNRNRSPFPRFKYGYKFKFCLCVLFSAILLLIIVPAILVKKSSSNSNIALNNPHTPVYNMYWNSEGNSNNKFYNSMTFGYSVFRDPCVVVTDFGIIETIVNSEISCVGDWCNNKVFSCDQSDNCYEPVYIIPISSAEFQNGCKNITGNIVFNWKKWSTQLQDLIPLDYTTEISTVYGFETLSYVRGIIASCGLSNRC